MKNYDLILEGIEAFSNFIIINESGNIVSLNHHYAQILGVTVKEAIGTPVADIIPNTLMLDVLKTGQKKMGYILNLYDHTEEKEVSMICNALPIIKNGKVIGAVAATIINNILDVAALHHEIERIKAKNQEYRRQIALLTGKKSPLDKVIGNSPSMIDLKKQILDYADSNLSVLITGETGVGKEVFAKALHQLSSRSMNNYVRINCAAIPKDLLESELFGYVRGAFSGALSSGKIGKFELANQGTILLDEISEMPMDLQSKLLRVLQEKEIERIGSVQTTKINVRILCSTNKNLEYSIQNGSFREDLYYRINVIELHIPPLRERKDDIEELCTHFIHKINSEYNYEISGIDPDVIEFFHSYRWPGNVRELEHVMERSAVLCKKGQINLSHCSFLADKIQKSLQESPAPSAPVRDKKATLKEKKDILETDMIISALKQTGGNKSKAARLLNMSRSVLYDKLKKYKISP